MHTEFQPIFRWLFIENNPQTSQNPHTSNCKTIEKYIRSQYLPSPFIYITNIYFNHLIMGFVNQRGSLQSPQDDTGYRSGTFLWKKGFASPACKHSKVQTSMAKNPHTEKVGNSFARTLSPHLHIFSPATSTRWSNALSRRRPLPLQDKEIFVLPGPILLASCFRTWFTRPPIHIIGGKIYTMKVRVNFSNIFYISNQ